MMGANASYPDRPSPSQPRAATVGRCAHHTFLVPDAMETVVTRDKKKKMSKLATLRKKILRPRRHSRSFDHARLIRELTSSWTIRELNALVEEYEASATLKELSILASLARRHANTFKEDLSALYDYKYCTDVDLIYHGTCFPVHRAILSIRCAFFRDLLSRYPTYGAQVPVNIRTKGVDVHMFSALLRYLYTGEFIIDESKLDHLVIAQLEHEFGVPNPLEHDLRTLLETGEYADAMLIFTTDSDAHDPLTPEGAGESSRTLKSELRCHKAVLAARSPFFRNLLLRRARSGEELTERALQSPTCIVLDESVIPKQYARVLLHAIYMDSVELTCIVHSSVSMCSLSEVQAMVAGKGHMTHTDEAMEIYGIGQFLDFPILSQGCEDIIVDTLSVENLVSVLHWSSQPHGSTWVHRQTMHFLREEFLQVAHSSMLFDLGKEYLVDAIRSDFLQAGELDVLTAVLKWGEHQLIRRMEEREPNLLSHTAHSVSKKGIKKRDLNDLELREILADVLPYVRTDHIIPPNHDTLSGAIKRGLISTPPSHMLGDDYGHGGQASAWIRTKNNGMFVKPRLFLPYYEETKSMLADQVSQVQENEVVRVRMVHMSPIPDTLYMVEDKGCSGAVYAPYIPSSTSTVDIIAGTIPVPDQDTLKAMLRREHSLQHTKLAQRSYSLPCSDRRALTREIQLRTVREFGFPDSTVEVLQGAPMYHEEESPVSEPVYHHHHHHRHHHHHHQHPHHHHSYAYHQVARPHTHPREDHHSPSIPATPVRSYSPIEKEPSTCSDSVLCETMPDIAMATSSMNQMSLQDIDLPVHGHGGDLELDLGDGNNHSGTGTLYI